MRLHGVPLSIISYCYSRFTSRFWGKLHEALGSRLNFRTTFHLQTDGQLEKIVQILEDMLQCCIIGFEGSWEKYFLLVEFTYNNSYHSSIKMALYEVLYGHKCRNLLYWSELNERKKGKLSPRFIGPYEVLQIIRPVAYRLALPPKLNRIHNVFHVSML
ncbi:reverse transcriptase [Gossypium australe]|uniref:Reverse transcriptase n=1 Tax=Gossypium australe TaxID=47621 RepID=A0A5B6X348_9ROSI|nr:reverse transcriptase [Gossypium australe]